MGLLITIAIFGIVWQSSRAVLTRMLDGVEPSVISEIRHAAEHVPGLTLLDVKARWLGHRLHADLGIAVDDNMTAGEVKALSATLERELSAHVPALAAVYVRLGAEAEGSGAARGHPERGHDHHHAPEPFRVQSELAEGLLQIVDTPQGERMRLTLSRQEDGLTATVLIDRPGETETLRLARATGDSCFQSSVAPAEPHDFSAELHLFAAGRTDVLPFRMVEPAAHHH